MVDRKWWLSKDQISALSDIEKVEFCNAWAEYWYYDIGINVLPGLWKIIDKEKKFIPKYNWKEHQDKPISELIFKSWLKNEEFSTGIAGVLGRVHRGDKAGWYYSEIDADNAIAISELLKWKGDLTLADLSKRTLVTQHSDNPNSVHVGIYSKIPLTKKEPDVSKSDETLPSFEVHCLGRLGTMAGTKHKKGYPMMFLPEGITQPIALNEEYEIQAFELFLNSICIKYGMGSYLNGNGHNSNGSTIKNGNNNNGNYQQQRDVKPLSLELQEIIRKRELNNPNVRIEKDHRHTTLIKIADSILFRYMENDEQVNDLKNFFVLINENYFKPPLGMQERNRIWDDAVNYVKIQKSEEGKRTLSVSEVLRAPPGDTRTVRGTVMKISGLFKVIKDPIWTCRSCNSITSLNDKDEEKKVPFVNIGIYTKNMPCGSCGKKDLALNFKRSVIEDSKLISLQNSDLNEDQDEEIEILVYSDQKTEIDNTQNIRAGEVVKVQGLTTLGQSHYYSSGNNGGSKLVTIMYSTFMLHESKRDVQITNNDIKEFHEVAKSKELDIITKLVRMFAPQVIGEESKKLAVLRSLVGSTDGKIHTLFIGDKGLAKTLLIIEGSKIIPNSVFVTIQHASSKTALSIVEKFGDVKIIVYGPIPRSSGAVVCLDEIQTWSLQEQAALLNIMQFGFFYLAKLGRTQHIDADTTILATVNPQDILYGNRTTISKSEMSISKPMLDRFDQVETFLDRRTEEEDLNYAGIKIDALGKTITLPPADYIWLTKYVLYARKLKPVLNDDAAHMAKTYWVKLRKSKVPDAGNRLLESIIKMSQAQAKLRLQIVVTAEIMEETLGYVTQMLLSMGSIANMVQDPRVTVIEFLSEVVHQTKGPISFYEALQKVCDKDALMRSWILGDIVKNVQHGSDNRRIREIYERFLTHIQQPQSRIIITCQKPLIVAWQTSKTAATDSKRERVEEYSSKILHPNDTYDTNDRNNFGLKSEKSDLGGLSFVSYNRTTSEESSNGLRYEYHAEVDAYRCVQCRSFYRNKTKDDVTAHPCNSLKGGP